MKQQYLQTMMTLGRDCHKVLYTVVFSYSIICFKCLGNIVFVLVPARQTPVKFVTTHTIARFGPGGHLVKVLPNRPLDNQPCKVEIHSIEVRLVSTFGISLR